MATDGRNLQNVDLTASLQVKIQKFRIIYLSQCPRMRVQVHGVVASLQAVCREDAVLLLYLTDSVNKENNFRKWNFSVSTTGQCYNRSLDHNNRQKVQILLKSGDINSIAWVNSRNLVLINLLAEHCKGYLFIRYKMQNGIPGVPSCLDMREL